MWKIDCTPRVVGFFKAGGVREGRRRPVHSGAALYLQRANVILGLFRGAPNKHSVLHPSLTLTPQGLPEAFSINN